MIIDPVIQVHRLSKSYGNTRALSEVSFTVPCGQILGYLGPNGAGKTTTINILSGILPLDGGKVTVCGHDVRDDAMAVKERLGVVPEESNLYPELTCSRNLEYLGELYGLPRPLRRARATELLEAFDLTDRHATPYRALSRGLKRRLTVAAALIHRPEVVFLDEPTAGLDVPSARSLRSFIKALSEDGTTVFLTTHNLNEAQALCDSVLILVKGKVVAHGTTEEIRERVDRVKTLTVVLSGEVDPKTLRQACPSIQSAEYAEGSWMLEVTDTTRAVRAVSSFAEEEGLRILEIATVRPSLEDTFMTILRDKETSERTRP